MSVSTQIIEFWAGTTLDAHIITTWYFSQVVATRTSAPHYFPVIIESYKHFINHIICSTVRMLLSPFPIHHNWYESPLNMSQQSLTSTASATPVSIRNSEDLIDDCNHDNSLRDYFCKASTITRTFALLPEREPHPTLSWKPTSKAVLNLYNFINQSFMWPQQMNGEWSPREKGKHLTS